MAIQEDIPVSTKKLVREALLIDSAHSTITAIYREDVSRVQRDFVVEPPDFTGALNWLLVATTAAELADRIETYLINNGYIVGTQIPD